MSKNFILADYRHDRSRRVDETIPELYHFIEGFTAQQSLQGWFEWFHNHFGLPVTIVQQFFKKSLSESFDYLNRQGFKGYFLRRTIPKYIIIYIGFIAYTFIYRQHKNIQKFDVDLIIDHMQWDGDLARFKSLIELFGHDNVVAVVPGQQEVHFSDIKIINRPKFKGYHIKFREYLTMISGIIIFLYYSIKVKINLFGVAYSILNSYFYYRSLFVLVRGKYCIMSQHYHTDAIKNYLFKKMGGKCSSTIQKNIHQQGHNGFYYDADAFFAISEKNADQAFKLGARIGDVITVGSFFMEYHWFANKHEQSKVKWDVVNFGGNSHFPGRYCDIYDTHNEDYLEHLQWMCLLSKEYPEFCIGFKHHSNYQFEPIEEKMFSDSSVEMIDQKKNSYNVAFQSKIIISWASTLVVEMLGHGKTAYYLDPQGRNGQFMNSNPDWDQIRITNYTDFKNKMVNGKNGGMNFKNIEKFCLKSNYVSKRIYDYLKRLK